MTRARRALVSSIATLIGCALFALSLSYVDLRELTRNPLRIAVALLLSLAASGAWHAIRTLAWARDRRRREPAGSRGSGWFQAFQGSGSARS